MRGSPVVRPSRARCPARAALAGNPSDGYAGAVLAVPVRSIAAVVDVEPSDRHRLSDATGTLELSDVGSLERAIETADALTTHALILATLGAWRDLVGTPPPCHISVASTIPRSVGLAGSSAIVIALWRALSRALDAALPAPDDLAEIALRIETDRLGIVAGLQDRLVLCHDRAMMMRFDTGRHVAVQTPALHWFVAHRTDTGTSSHVVHGDLRRRFDAGDPTVRRAMSTLATAAQSAANALAHHDVAMLGRAMDHTFDLRATIIDLDPADVALVTAARSVGAHANYAGSGGAVIVLASNADGESAARRALARVGGAICEIAPGETPPPYDR